MTGRTAIVSGGAQGIGEGAVRALHAAGAAVVIADILTNDGEKLAAELGERARFAELDVRDAAAWSRVVALAEAGYGRVDVLVNSAGVALFLAGDDARFITGADLVVDGGDLAGAANWASVPDAA